MPSTLLPFLYQTRTILRIPRRTPAVFVRSLHATCLRSRAHNDIPFASDTPGQDLPLEPAPRGTITPSERQVFERIFADIKARGLKPQTREDEPAATQASSASRSALLIMQQAAHDARQSRPATVQSPSVLSGAAKDRSKALLRFPPDLRAAASKALDQIQTQVLGAKAKQFDDENDIEGGDEFVDEGWRAPPHSFGRAIELDAKRHPERMRVENMIIGASTDFELWDVLEKEVFTMPARLGLDTGDAQTNDEEPLQREAEDEVDTKGVTEAEAKEAAEEDAAVESSEEVAEETEAQAEAINEAETNTESPIEAGASRSPQPPAQLNLYIHGPLYPAYLLLALRRLNMAFRTHSPLAFSLLPRIKELGLKSYVLGVSTPFYNELLRIYWQCRGDLGGMFNLLEEMQHCGLYFDEQTASIMDHVDQAVFSLANSKKPNSAFSKTFMKMPEYELAMRSRIRHWRTVIDISIKQRDADFSY